MVLEKGDGDRSKREMIMLFSNRHDIGENMNSHYYK